MRVILYIKDAIIPTVINNCTNYSYHIQYDSLSMHFEETIDKVIAETLLKDAAPLMVAEHIGAHILYSHCKGQIISVQTVIV